MSEEIPLSKLYAIFAQQRHHLIPLFEAHRRDRVFIDSLLKGHHGTASADHPTNPTVARIAHACKVAWDYLWGCPSFQSILGIDISTSYWQCRWNVVRSTGPFRRSISLGLVI